MQERDPNKVKIKEVDGMICIGFLEGEDTPVGFMEQKFLQIGKIVCDILLHKVSG